MFSFFFFVNVYLHYKNQNCTKSLDFDKTENNVSGHFGIFCSELGDSSLKQGLTKPLLLAKKKKTRKPTFVTHREVYEQIYNQTGMEKMITVPIKQAREFLRFGYIEVYVRLPNHT